MKNIKLYLDDTNDHSSEWRTQIEQRAKSVRFEFIANGKISKDTADYIIYVFTPKSDGISTIVNVVNDSNYFKGKTIFLVLNEDNGFTPHQVKSLTATGKMVKLNGGCLFDNWDELTGFLHS